ncbi:flagellar cap protein FliD [Romboutsia maritimum]|uniref:Flagellar hook-associated protein 2 n=1 Tax=Romboutsia maritimum TaxID=2020948 RepID=A0A371IVK1_9FIRM|nr:flagellar filament capping protein FliD [Romboutsia maritimum]RDY24505.1 flagellar cap protein FliD [Romboutsia maritimum]
MSTINSVRIPGLATGMDTDTMIKDMLKLEQNKVDKAKQKEQSIKWQQETYRDTIKEMKGFYDKYLTTSSPDCIMNSKSWSTMSVSSSNENVITATGSAGANNVDYSFDVKKLAKPPKVSVDWEGKGYKNDTKLNELSLSGTKSFKIDLGNGKESKIIELKETDTVETMIKNINDSMSGEIKATYSEMTGQFSIVSKETGTESKLKIVDVDSSGVSLGTSSSLVFLNLQEINEIVDASGNVTIETPPPGFDGEAQGSNSYIKVTSKDGTMTEKILTEKLNTFTRDGITYTVNSTGTSDLTSKPDTKSVVDKMKTFVEDYNKIMDKMYDFITQKKNADYPPLTDAQKEDMSEEEIERWEKKAKIGLLRNDKDMRAFMDNMNKAIFGDKMEELNKMGIKSASNYNDKGQLYIDEEKFTKALQNNGDQVYSILSKNTDSVLENMKSTMYKYVGTSTSIFAKKAGLEKTASASNNLYSVQIRKQEQMIKELQNKMKKKETQLYKRFATLESSMNRFNSQMNYLTAS